MKLLLSVLDCFRLESVALVLQNTMLEDMLDNEEQLSEQLEALPYLVG